MPSRLPLLLVVTLLAACSPRRAAEWVLLSHRFRLTGDIAYGAAVRQRLDVYRPKAASAPAPVVVFFYGGRWQGGSREQYRLLGDAFAQRGVVAVVPDYRLYPEVRFPAWIEDGARAVRWVHDSIAHYGGDPSNIILAGHSAGAHTAMLLALDPEYLAAAGVPRGAIRGAASLAGPVGIEWSDADVRALMGEPAQYARTYPLTFAGDSGAAPLLFQHGGRDRTVSPVNSTRLADRVRAHGGCARVVMYPGLDHVGTVLALSLPQFRIAPVLDDLLAFVRHPRGGCSLRPAG
ncbi:MAG: alpha/beta hydrolase [Gemmatimonadales bacterium]|nr:alpha/beta hydrolase [Gemmatimonadales bacterium]